MVNIAQELNSHSTHHDFYIWLSRFSSIAILGLLSLLYLLGKCIYYISSKRICNIYNNSNINNTNININNSNNNNNNVLYYIYYYFKKVCNLKPLLILLYQLNIPSVLISGFIALLLDYILYSLDPILGSNVEKSLQSFRQNTLPFVFASIMLGLGSKNKLSFFGTMEMVLHEGMPMLIYNQLLIWGQSSCCLLLSLILYFIGIKVPLFFSPMVALGLEAESDIHPSLMPQGKYQWSQQVVEDSESLGLHLSVFQSFGQDNAKP